MPDFDPTTELPAGFSAALGQQPSVLDAFGRLSGSEKAHYAARAHQVSSKAEMRALIAELEHPYTS